MSSLETSSLSSTVLIISGAAAAAILLIDVVAAILIRVYVRHKYGFHPPETQSVSVKMPGTTASIPTSNLVQATNDTKASLATSPTNGSLSPASPQPQPSSPTSTKETVYFGLVIPPTLRMSEGEDYQKLSELTPFRTSNVNGSWFEVKSLRAKDPPDTLFWIKRQEKSQSTLRKEVAILWLLHEHRCIARLLGFNEKELTFVLPRFGLGTLDKYVAANSSYSVLAACILITDVAQALKQLHENGIVFRDLRPANIFVDLDERGPRAVLGTFSQAVVMQAIGLKKSETPIYGFPNDGFVYHLAPEAWLRTREGAPKPKCEEATPSDVYSLATIACFLLNRGQMGFA